MPERYTSFGVLFREARHRAGLSQGDVARNLDVTTAYVSDIERHRRAAMTWENTRAVADLFDTNFARLLFAKGQAEKHYRLPVAGLTHDVVASHLSARWPGLTPEQLVAINRVVTGTDLET